MNATYEERVQDETQREHAHKVRLHRQQQAQRQREQSERDQTKTAITLLALREREGPRRLNEQEQVEFTSLLKMDSGVMTPKATIRLFDLRHSPGIRLEGMMFFADGSARTAGGDVSFCTLIEPSYATDGDEFDSALACAKYFRAADAKSASFKKARELLLGTRIGRNRPEQALKMLGE